VGLPLGGLSKGKAKQRGSTGSLVRDRRRRGVWVERSKASFMRAPSSGGGTALNHSVEGGGDTRTRIGGLPGGEKMPRERGN